ncbi:MAG: hypothetical protein R2731_05480 [Nocardioides sp.]
MALVALGAGVLGLTRGVLTARRRFAAVGASLAAENAVRLAAAAVIAGARS